jgi:hypothetical protein
MTKAKEKLAKCMAEAIVNFLERVGGPVTLAQIEREIPGFAERDDRASSWSFVTEADDGEVDGLLWDGMTGEGYAALRAILTERRVAIQMAPSLIYWLEGRFPAHQNWAPVSLLPARMANLETPRLLIRGSQQVLDQIIARASTERVDGFRVLGPAA